MIQRLVLAAVAGAIAFLVCILAGMLLGATGLPIATTIGAFLEKYAIAIAFLVAVAHFFGWHIGGL
jgi:uncharacterized Tic20 family protein